MRQRSLPYILSFAAFLLIYTFPLLEYDLNWSYRDLDTRISFRSGSSILDETKKFNYSRVPGIEPGWSKVNLLVTNMLKSIEKSCRKEYSFSWKYETVSSVTGVNSVFHINHNVGGYVGILHPLSLNISDSYKSICYFSNIDTVYGSSGFSANALSVTQSLLALKELSHLPGLKNPIVVVISDTKENGSNVLWNMFSIPDLQMCAYSILLDSLGVAQTVPSAIHITDLGGVAGRRIRRISRYFRASNYILDSASSLSLLSSSETSLLRGIGSHGRPAISKHVYTDNQFCYHTGEDTYHVARAAAAKARYDRLVDVGRTLGQIDSASIKQSSRFLGYSSYISVFGVTLRISSWTQVLLAIIGCSLSIAFFMGGSMGSRPAIQSAIGKASVIIVLQVAVVCGVFLMLLIWFAFDPLCVHKIDISLMAIIICLFVSSSVLFTFQLTFYSQYFIRDYSGGLMSSVSLVFAAVALLFACIGLHSSLNLAIVAFLFGLTNIPLFLRKIQCDCRTKWRKIMYASSLIVCGMTCFFINMGSACSTLHVVYAMMSSRDTAASFITVISFWAAIFPLLFSVSCCKVIYMDDVRVFAPHSSLVSSALQEDLIVEEIRSGTKGDEREMEKMVHRRFLRWFTYTSTGVLVLLILSIRLLPWTDDKPLRTVSGVTYRQESVEGRMMEETSYGRLMIAGHHQVLAELSRVLPKLSLRDNYTVASVVHTNCYLQNHILDACLQVELTRDGIPVTFPLRDIDFNTSHLYRDSELLRSVGNAPINYTAYCVNYTLVIPRRQHTDVYGYPLVHFRIYTTNVENTDSKIYNNRLSVTVQFHGNTSTQSGFVLSGVLMANNDETMLVHFSVWSRVGSQVLFRVTDVSRAEPEPLQVLNEGLGNSFVSGGLTGLSSLSHTTNYFISY